MSHVYPSCVTYRAKPSTGVPSGLSPNRLDYREGRRWVASIVWPRWYWWVGGDLLRQAVVTSTSSRATKFRPPATPSSEVQEGKSVADGIQRRAPARTSDHGYFPRCLRYFQRSSNLFHWCPWIRDISYREPFGDKQSTNLRYFQRAVRHAWESSLRPQPRQELQRPAQTQGPPRMQAAPGRES